MTKRKSNAEKTQEGLDFSAKVLEFGRQQGREEVWDKMSKKEKIEQVKSELSKDCPDDCCVGSHAKWLDDNLHNNDDPKPTDCPSCGGDCCDGHVESTAEYVKRVGKSMMLDEICDPEPLSGYTLLDEIEFTLYSAQSEMNRLQKLIFLYKEQQE